MAEKVSDVTALARALLNDVDQTNFTDALLIPLVASAYRDLQSALYQEAGVSYVKTEAQLIVPAGCTLITDPLTAATIAAPAAGAVRSANLVTITTTAAHGLQVGQAVVIAGVTDASFNGTFVILSVPTSTTFTYAQVAMDATSGNGTATNTPQIPADFVGPHAMWERGEGSSERFVPMDETSTLPDTGISTNLRWWTYLANQLSFIGATRDVRIKLRYEKGLPNLAGVNDPIGIRSAVNALAYMTAAIAARSRGVASAAADFIKIANDQISQLVATYIKPKQRQPVRRRPYGNRRKVIYI